MDIWKLSISRKSFNWPDCSEPPIAYGCAFTHILPLTYQGKEIVHFLPPLPQLKGEKQQDSEKSIMEPGMASGSEVVQRLASLVFFEMLKVQKQVQALSTLYPSCIIA
ncbi:hypothetical protein RHSIM_Rhsim07G0184100 [Rhododendron simsii]|uniref:Uncharacterized protein n=1 Tax=Rhododendron simsii TaxID=118357 RepID=A0A834GQJ4_RHOSS|nr:hypothetical protein RHSIM_Rhsim07G0184100 [Rhododendron simsii]